MEAVVAGASALVSVLGTKAVEKAGEGLGEAVSFQIGKLIQLLRARAPQTVQALQQAETREESKLVGEVVEVARGDEELAAALRELATAMQTPAQPVPAELKQRIDKIGNQYVNSTVNIGSQTFNF